MPRGSVPTVPLRREVEPPQRQPTGLGVMLLASASMFFAVAGSAFILRARMNDGCPYRARHGAPVRAVVRVAPPELRAAPEPPVIRYATPTTDCQTRRVGPSGEQLIDFRVCP